MTSPKILSEYDLFIRKIKPAILLPNKGNHFKQLQEGLEGVYSYLTVNGKSTMFSWFKLDKDVFINSTVKFGIALGYYPASCESFQARNKEVINKHRGNMTLIREAFKGLKKIQVSVEGMSFICENEWEEALLWCKESYADKICSAIGVCRYCITYENTTKVGVIRKRKGRST